MKTAGFLLIPQRNGIVFPEQENKLVAKGDWTLTGLRIRIRIGSGFNRASGSGSGSRKATVSPAYSYGYVSLALVKHSNEGGPGPRYNMKEDPGSSTLIMKREHGNGVPCDPGQVIRIFRCTSPPLPLPPPPSEQPGQSPLPSPLGTYSSPCQGTSWGQPRRKSHFSLWFEVGGHGLG